MRRPSSTSSSRRARRSRPWIVVTAGAVALIAVAEIVLRFPLVSEVWGPPDVFYRPDVLAKEDALESFIAANGDPDVLFIGSSVVRANISPVAFDQRLAELGIEATSFNAGLTALWPDQVRLYLDRFWLERTRPAVIVQAVRYEEVVMPRPATDFAGWEDGRYEQLWDDPSLTAAVHEILLRGSRLVQYSGRLTKYLQDPTSRSRPLLRPLIDDRGHSAATGNLEEALETSDRENIAGGRAATVGFAEAIESETFEAGLRALDQTAAIAGATGAVFVLVNMPEHGDKFLSRPDGEARYSFYVATLAAYAERRGISFVDVTDADPFRYRVDELFSDFHHLTPGAAIELSRRLADAIYSAGVLDGSALGRG